MTESAEVPVHTARPQHHTLRQRFELALQLRFARRGRQRLDARLACFGLRVSPDEREQLLILERVECLVVHCVGVRLQRHRTTNKSGVYTMSGMDEFDRYRAEMNEKLLGSGHLGIKRFFALDTQAYEDGALDKKTKELMGLVASTVLRCDDCITYHVKQCVSVGVNREEFLDAFNVALVVGGSITIPHLRRAVERVDALLEQS